MFRVGRYLLLAYSSVCLGVDVSLRIAMETVLCEVWPVGIGQSLDQLYLLSYFVGGGLWVLSWGISFSLLYSQSGITLVYVSSMHYSHKEFILPLPDMFM